MRRVRGAGARVDEDVALRVGRHAGRLAQVDVVGQLQQIGVGVEGNLGNGICADSEAPSASSAGDGDEHVVIAACHRHRSSYRPPRVFGGLRASA